jgi:NAD(P) transhydrogenase subunit beta
MATVIHASYLLAAFLFIMGLKQMSSPATARAGIIWAGVGMLIATIATFVYPGMENYVLMITAVFIGAAIAWYAGEKVSMTAMPQMVALYNGMGGGAAGAIGATELVKVVGGQPLPPVTLTLAVLGGLIGTVSFTGSLIAFAKLQGIMTRSLVFQGQNLTNMAILAVAVIAGAAVILGQQTPAPLIVFFLMAAVFGVLMTLPIGGADMPVVISLYNALTGLAVGLEGFVLNNAAMIIAGTVVGAAGTLLTQLMAKAMNRSLANVLFSGFGSTTLAADGEVAGSLKPIDLDDAAIMMAYGEKVIVVPGYGMAVAQAQHKIWELAQVLTERGVKVEFAIHPVAGRMPGHMNVLLAEAGVPYDRIFDLDEINAGFQQADVAIVIGANDVVNPAARNDTSSPIYGMPILNADQAKNVIVIKRGSGKGFSGIENNLFYMDNCRMLYGDGQQVAAKLVQAVKRL